MSGSEVRRKCRHCGSALSADDVPCPRRGESGRDIFSPLGESRSIPDEAMDMRTFSGRKRPGQIVWCSPDGRFWR